MKFLIDKAKASIIDRIHSGLVDGQLLTPLTRYANWGGRFAIDNGAYSRFNRKHFANLLEANREHLARCLFVCVPDVVGDARRTLEIFKHRLDFVPSYWPIALVAQDGLEACDIPWDCFACLFIGGTTGWKDSKTVEPLIKAAQILGKHVHVGRVNTYKRYRRFSILGCDTCDGSGVSRYDHMMDDIVSGLQQEAIRHPLFESQKDDKQIVVEQISCTHSERATA